MVTLEWQVSNSLKLLSAADLSRVGDGEKCNRHRYIYQLADMCTELESWVQLLFQRERERIYYKTVI
jgi:hypothetical protein